MLSIGQKLDQNRGIGPGFDFLRVFLAISIVLAHSFQLNSGAGRVDVGSPIWVLPFGQVPMFFALSGFLITGSALRLRLRDFIINRSIRIIPALAVDILVAAIIVGPLVSPLSFYSYYTNAQFYHYFFNIIGFPHYLLPQVFDNNPLRHTVNGSLWTIPFEIGCYILMSILIISKSVHSKIRMIVISLTIILFVVFFKEYFYEGKNEIISIMINYTNKNGIHLYSYFCAGSCLYIFRYNIPFSHRLAGCCAAIVAFMCGMGSGIISYKITNIILIPVITYLMCYIGMLKIPPLPIYRHGDYSYGIYLYGFPLQQTIIFLNGGKMDVLPHFVLSLLATTAMAAMSWHMIEKPILSLRKKFSFTARKGSGDPLSHTLPTAAPEAAIAPPHPSLRA